MSHPANAIPELAVMAERTRILVQYGTTSIEVIREGRGPAVVMLPSLGRDSEDYDDVAAAIAARGYTVLRPQPRGLGRSVGRMEGLTLADFAADVAQVIEVAGTGPATIFGHAFGNWVARMTASAYPHLVRGVVIAAAAAKEYPPELTSNIRKIVDTALPASTRLDLLQRTFFSPGNDASVWLEGWHPDVRKSQFDAHLATEQGAWWSAGNAPILDLQAADDPFKPLHKRFELQEELGPRVTIAVIEHASHALLPEQPQAVVNAVTAWLERLQAD